MSGSIDIWIIENLDRDWENVLIVYIWYLFSYKDRELLDLLIWFIVFYLLEFLIWIHINFKHNLKKKYTCSMYLRYRL